jgi:hypothetical protein
MPRIAEFDRPGLAALLGKQHGVITRQQALASGMSREAVKYRTRRGGTWQAVLPGVYAAQGGPPTLTQREVAALLYAGPLSVLTGPAALRRHGLTTALRRHSATGREQVDVLIPASRQRRDAGFARLHRTTRLPERICVEGEIRFALPPRAVADAVRGLELPAVRAVVAEAVQQGRCTIALLAGELAAGPVQDSAPFRQALGEVGEGVRSAAEGDLRDLIAWARLPEPLYNPRLFVGREYLGSPDCWWPDAGVAGEADSREWHFSPSDWEKTLARHARMSAHGIVVLHFTPRQIRRERAQVAAHIRSALASRQDHELPHIRTLPAS